MEQAKNWRHYVVRDTGECTVVRSEGARERISYQLGIVETGNSRVFAGYFITATLGEDEEVTGEDSGSLVAALWRLARNVFSGLHQHGRRYIIHCRTGPRGRHFLGDQEPLRGGGE